MEGRAERGEAEEEREAEGSGSPSGRAPFQDGSRRARPLGDPDPRLRAEVDQRAPLRSLPRNRGPYAGSPRVARVARRWAGTRGRPPLSFSSPSPFWPPSDLLSPPRPP